jgi:guanylate kinase
MLRELIPELGYSVSATTRAPRPGEVEGVNYYYKTKEEFERMLRDGEIVEHTVYMDNYYGTPASEIKRCLEGGTDLILEIEVEGAMQIKKLFPESVAVMLIPPTFAILESRLRGRGTETEDVIVRRLSRAHDEVAQMGKYDYVTVNREGEAHVCAAEIADIIRAEHLRASRRTYLADEFFA